VHQVGSIYKIITSPTNCTEKSLFETLTLAQLIK